jgi:hypothetical protein
MLSGALLVIAPPPAAHPTALRARLRIVLALALATALLTVDPFHLTPAVLAERNTRLIFKFLDHIAILIVHALTIDRIGVCPWIAHSPPLCAALADRFHSRQYVRLPHARCVAGAVAGLAVLVLAFK